MKATYLNHSGFLLEWEHSYWLFDYYKGTIPELNPEKDIFVFCSHSHGDHFNPEVFALADKYPSVKFIFSNEVKKACRKLERGHSEKTLPEILFVQSRTDAAVQDQAGNSIEIHTLQSTDCGCAFFIKYEGKTVYHAGDLHWWSWPGEGDAWNKKMTADYKKEMEFLEGKQIDLAFTPLDPRQEGDYALGINYLAEHTEISHLIPMHFWDDFSVMDRYLKEYPVDKKTQFYTIKQDGQRWEIVL